MPVKHAIGAGGRVYMGTAAAPETIVANSTYDKTKFIKGLTMNQQIGNDNVTTMDADLANFAEEFIQALTNASGSMEALYGAPTGTFLLFLTGVKNADNHADGRGKLDVWYDPYGTASGNLRLKFTLLLTTIPLTGNLGTAIGGSVGFQCSGEVEAVAI